MTFVVHNLGTAYFTSQPDLQVAVQDSKGFTNLPLQSIFPQSGGTITIGPRVTETATVDVPLSAGVAPVTIGYNPYGNSGPSVRWTVPE